MLFLKNLYIITTILLLTSIIISIAFSYLNKRHTSVILKKLQLVVFSAIITCFIFYWVKNEFVAELIWASYLILLDITLYEIYEYICSLDKENEQTKKLTIHKKLYISMIIVDAILLFFNHKTHLSFLINAVDIDNIFTTWIVSFNKLFLIRLLLCYLISVAILIHLIKDILKSSKFNRPIYITLLIMFLFILLSNVIFMLTSQQLIYDFSTIIYGYLLLIVNHFSVVSIPKYIQKNLISISSENISDGILCFDDAGNCVYLNRFAREFYDGNRDNKVWIDSYLNSEVDVLMKTEVVDFHNEPHSFKIEFRRLRDEKGRVSGCYIKMNDCTSEVLSMQREAYRAIHDELTDLYTRDYFFREMSRLLKESPEIPRYLVCTDIKDFKLINELFGSDFGDRLLVRQAEMLKKANREGIIHGRISGDRYAMLIPKEYYNPELAKKNSDKIIEMEKEINFKLVIYIGIYEIKDPTENVHTMYDKASLAIKNIESGSNTSIIYYDDTLMNRLMLEKTIVNEFDMALAENRFEMFLQPQIDVKTKKCLGAEALVRWNHPERGLIAPGSFIKALEKSDQIHKLDAYIWEKAAERLSIWKKKGIESYISVNISVKDFYYYNLYDYFTKLVEKYDISPASLNLEVTESVIINDNKNHRVILNKLQEYGFLIEMDDFGSGYSSLNVLKDISMNVLKIDMGFLGQTGNEDRAALIVASIVKMAKSLKMEVVSEGVETKEQAEILEKYNVDIFQGYLYSKPIPVAEFEEKYLVEVNK